MNYKKILLLLSLEMVIGITGCPLARIVSKATPGIAPNSSYESFQRSMETHNFPQAAERLVRCSRCNTEECLSIMEEAKSSGLRYHQYLEKRQLRIEIIERARGIKEGGTPWDKLQLVSEIEQGNVKESYPGEAKEHLRNAFLGFGECAKDADPKCMTQYARMILERIEPLPEDKKEIGKEEAIYWLNLAARYGNNEARKDLIALDQPIPSPDLSVGGTVAEKEEMEALKQEVESIKNQRRREKKIETLEDILGIL